MQLEPLAIWIANVVDRIRIAQFRADTHQVEWHCAKKSACGFDCDVKTCFVQCCEQFIDTIKDHGLAASHDDMTDFTFDCLVNDGRDAARGAFRIPTRVRRVTPRTTKITARQSNEKTRNARKFAFALYR